LRPNGWLKLRAVSSAVRPRHRLDLRQLDSADRQEPLPGAHDDLANAVAGALTLAAGGPPRMIISDALLAWSRIPSRPRSRSLFAQSYRVF